MYSFVLRIASILCFLILLWSDFKWSSLIISFLLVIVVVCLRCELSNLSPIDENVCIRCCSPIDDNCFGIRLTAPPFVTLSSSDWRRKSLSIKRFSISDGFFNDIRRKILFVALIDSRLGNVAGIIDDFLLSNVLYLTSLTDRIPFGCSFGIVTVSTLRKLARPSESMSISWLQLLQQFKFFVVNRLRIVASMGFTSETTGCNMYDAGRAFLVSNGSIDFDDDRIFFLTGAFTSVDDGGDSSDLIVDGREVLLKMYRQLLLVLLMAGDVPDNDLGMSHTFY